MGIVSSKSFYFQNIVFRASSSRNKIGLELNYDFVLHLMKNENIVKDLRKYMFTFDIISNLRISVLHLHLTYMESAKSAISFYIIVLNIVYPCTVYSLHIMNCWWDCTRMRQWREMMEFLISLTPRMELSCIPNFDMVNLS